MKGYFDGASRGNPGNAAAGALLVNGAGEVVWEASHYLGVKTNNEAEYLALITLLRAAKERGVSRLNVFGDSKLVVSQAAKLWKINKAHLRALAEEVWKLSEGMDVTYEWMPRSGNSRADELANRALDAAEGK